MTRIETQLESLFASLAEQVKLPLVQIRHAAETGQTDIIDTTAQAALRLIDGYLLSVRLQQQGQLQLEPVSVSSLLYDVADELRPFAKLHNCEIELAVAGRYEPVMAEKQVLKAALLALGYGFIGATSVEGKQRPVIHLAVRRRGGGMTTGVYSAGDGIHANLLKQARRLAGRAHQTLPGFTSESGAGVLIADRLLAQQGTAMHVSRMYGLQGLATTLSPSRQLSLV